jgi:AcrR family transcriptional regulator
MASGATAAAVTRFDVKRANIVGGAKDVFLRHGFERASMDGIAAAAGVSKMTVYRYFRSKEELFAGVIRDLCERIIDEDLERMLARRPEEALRAFARKMVTILFARDTIELHRIVIAESRRFPALGRLFYKSGPEACIAMLATPSTCAIPGGRPRSFSNSCVDMPICACFLACRRRSRRASWTRTSRVRFGTYWERGEEARSPLAPLS